MAVRIRLQRHGRRKRPFYYVVVADSRAKRDGKFIERLGSYDPMQAPPLIDIDPHRAAEWLMEGAQPSETARTLLRKAGALYKRHLLEGMKKGALTAEEVEEKFAAWMQQSAERHQAAVDKLHKQAEAAAAERLAREKKYAQQRVKQATPPPAAEEGEESDEVSEADAEQD